ncbi:subtilisin-like protein [Ceratobasidium sp. AG-I]|nr:subtilisin-like protein [Ceratobasidium sp. AG-I]
MRSTVCFSALVLLVPVFSAPPPLFRSSNAPVRSSWTLISKVKQGVSLLSVCSDLTRGFTGGSSITYRYTLIPAFAASLKGADLALVRQSPNIEYIEQDVMLELILADRAGVDGEAAIVERGNIAYQVMNESQTETQNGAGVTVYGIDTGIFTEHECFAGRATWGKTFGGYPDQDGNGHGTHTAGTAVGATYGVASSTNIIAVKVLSDEGSGAYSDVIAGVEYAATDHKMSGAASSIATMSLGGPPSQALDDAVKTAIAGGLHFTIAAGNSNMPAETSSPADVAEANTIGAVDSNKNNEKASFSNYGKLIDVWAPGVNIKSAWIGNPDAENTISGTSMATPYVAGILAVALGKYGQMSPADLSEILKDNAVKTVTFSTADAGAGLISNHLLAKIW